MLSDAMLALNFVCAVLDVACCVFFLHCTHALCSRPQTFRYCTAPPHAYKHSTMPLHHHLSGDFESVAPPIVASAVHIGAQADRAVNTARTAHVRKLNTSAYDRAGTRLSDSLLFVAGFVHFN